LPGTRIVCAQPGCDVVTGVAGEHIGPYFCSRHNTADKRRSV
jgi:hypothetical protein